MIFFFQPKKNNDYWSSLYVINGHTITEITVPNKPNIKNIISTTIKVIKENQQDVKNITETNNKIGDILFSAPLNIKNEKTLKYNYMTSLSYDNSKVNDFDINLSLNIKDYDNLHILFDDIKDLEGLQKGNKKIKRFIIDNAKKIANEENMTFSLSTNKKQLTFNNDENEIIIKINDILKYVKEKYMNGNKSNQLNQKVLTTKIVDRMVKFDKFERIMDRINISKLLKVIEESNKEE